VVFQKEKDSKEWLSDMDLQEDLEVMDKSTLSEKEDLLVRQGHKEYLREPVCQEEWGVIELL